MPSVGTCVEEPRGRWRRAVLETPRLVCNPELYLIFRARLCERGTRTTSRRLINHSYTVTRSAGLCIAAAAAHANLPASMSGDVNKSHGSADPSVYLYVPAQKHLTNTHISLLKKISQLIALIISAVPVVAKRYLSPWTPLLLISHHSCLVKNKIKTLLFAQISISVYAR